MSDSDEITLAVAPEFILLECMTAQEIESAADRLLELAESMNDRNRRLMQMRSIAWREFARVAPNAPR